MARSRVFRVGLESVACRKPENGTVVQCISLAFAVARDNSVEAVVEASK